jgi:adsorption protein B
VVERIADLAGWLLACAARELSLFASVGLVIGGLDDLVVDALWIGRGAWRRLTVYSRFRRATLETLPPPKEPGRIAVFIGAWQEAAVIGPMLRAALKAIRHDDYRIYIGTYPNDRATADAIRAIDDHRLRIVGGARPGPTTKAECLNRVWRAMLADEAASGQRFKAIVLHDAEDVIHAGELALHDRMIERFDLVQVPVLPLVATESRWARTVSATYADEFAEAHGKSLVLREAIGASVPSAGVGCAIERGMMDRIAAEAGGLPFAEDCLTEDYELGLRVRAMGGRGAFVAMPEAPGCPLVAVRAHFPETMEAAIRQKTRWITGIALAGWDRMRWRGGFAERWMRLRDRRALIAAVVLAAAYVAPLPTFLCWVAGVPIDWPPAMRGLLVATSGLLVWRLGMRALLVAPIYGVRHALLAIPRVFIGNLIEMEAARRALFTYVPGAVPRWDKTQHRFPDGAL